MSNVIHKANAPSIVTKAKSGDGYTFVISSEEPDLVGDIVVQAGMRPVAERIPAQIDHSGSVRDLIGYWSDIKAVGKKTFADLNLFQKGVSEVADFVRALLDSKVQMAASIGFKGDDVEPINPKDPWAGKKFIKSTLLEVSVVSVPCHPQALSVAKSLNLSQKAMAMVMDDGLEQRRAAALEKAKKLLKV